MKSGWNSFIRNSWLSLATIMIMSLTVLVITNLFFFNYATKTVLSSLKDKVDISVYFNQDVAEEQILRVQKSLALLDNVKSVDYVSQNQALDSFKEKHKDNSILLRSLEELQENPLQPSLNVKTDSASQYDAVVSFLENSNYKNLIDKINYQQNKDVITRFSSLTKNAQLAAWIFTILLAFVAILVAFNTIRLAIYNWRNEIGVMKLVGASNMYTRMPFLFEGALYGIFSALISLAIIVPLLYFCGPKIANFMTGVELWHYFIANIWEFLILQFGLGIVLGVVGSYLAVMRYLEV